jgi:uncharacterized protein involved in exopolysaccharide biosynthesis
MNDAHIFTQAKADDDGISLMEVLIALAKHKKRIVLSTLTAAILSVGGSFLIPNEYKASVKLLPPQQSQSSAAALLSQLGGVASMAAGAAGLKNPSDLYVGMLQSRTVADRMVARFNLKKVYDVELQEKARKELIANTKVTAEKNGLISIDVEDRDPKRSAQLANAYVEELLHLTKTLAITEASQRRVFFERQLENTKNNLAQAEVVLKGAMDTRGVISVDVESRAMMETMARLKAQISAKEIERNSMRAFVTETNPNFRRVEEQLSSLRGELSKLENGRPSVGDAEDDGKKQAGLANIKLLRDVKYYQMLYEMLAKQYEVARLDEAKDPSIIQTLDAAVEPERKSKPSRGLIVIVVTLLTMFLSMGSAYFSEVRRKGTPEEAARWNELRAHLGLK